MKLRTKTKEQLIREGWVENKKSIYYRLSIDGMKNITNRYSYNIVGTLTDFQVDNLLGIDVEIKEVIHRNHNLPYIKVYYNWANIKHEANLPYSVFQKLTKKKLVEVNKALTPIELSQDFGDSKVKVLGDKIIVGCKQESVKNVQKIFNELKKLKVLK